jgi:hypothetical protein
MSRDKFAVHEGSKTLLDRRSRFTFAVYGELRSTDNSDEPKRLNHLPVSLKLGLNSTGANNLPLSTSQESNRSRQPKTNLAAV